MHNWYRRPRSVEEWTTAHVGSWLDDIGLRDYERQKFMNEYVNGCRLLRLDIEKLTVAPYHLMRREAESLLLELLRIIPVAIWKVHHVVFWLGAIVLIDEEETKKFVVDQVNGPLLLELDIDELEGDYKLEPQDAIRLFLELLRIIPVTEWTVNNVDCWLATIDMCAKKRLRFFLLRVDGPLLLELDKEDLTGYPLILTNLEAKKLLHHLEPIRPCPEEKRKVIREMICHENTLYDQRRSHFAVLQGFFWAAASILMQSNKELVFVVALAGFVVSVVAYPPMKLSYMAIEKLMEKVYTAENPSVTDSVTGREPDKDVGLPVIGLDWPVIGTSNNDTRFRRSLYLCNRPELMPLALMGGWIAFAAVLAVTADKSNPKEFTFVRNEDVPILIALVGNESNIILINNTGK